METIQNADTYTHGAFDKWPQVNVCTCQWPSREIGASFGVRSTFYGTESLETTSRRYSCTGVPNSQKLRSFA